VLLRPVCYLLAVGGKVRLAPPAGIGRTIRPLFFTAVAVHPGRVAGIQYSPWREWPAVVSAAMATLSVWQW